MKERNSKLAGQVDDLKADLDGKTLKYEREVREKEMNI